MRHSWFIFFILFSVSYTQATEIPDFSHLKIYGVSTPALHSIEETVELLKKERDINKQNFSGDTQSALQRYLIFDVLNHYVAFLLNLSERPGEDYFKQFETVEKIYGEQFPNLLTETTKQVISIAKNIRFDISLVKLATKHISNSKQPDREHNEVNLMFARLNKISQRLEKIYPESYGELPPILISFSASFFNPDEPVGPVSCRNPLPNHLKERLLEGLGNN